MSTNRFGSAAQENLDSLPQIIAAHANNLGL
jgi:hypothetical protein